MAGLTTSDEFAGDFGTPEQEVPSSGLPGIDWETCMTMNDTWGFKQSDTNWKSADELVRTLVDVASKGGNLLLNVGPDSRGRIPQASIERLEAIGDWLAINGESVYGTSAGPFARALPWGRCTRRDLPDGSTRLYLHIFDWPENGTLRLPLRNRVRLAFQPNPDHDTRALKPHESPRTSPWTPIPSTQADNEILLDLDDVTHKLPVTVIAIDIEGAPDAVQCVIRPGSNGSITLCAVDAVIHGHTARYESGGGKDNIGFWTNVADSVSWTFHTDRTGSYAVLLTYACDPTTPGGTFKLVCSGQELTGTIAATDSWTDFREFSLGEISISNTGSSELRIQPIAIPHNALMNLKSIELRPSE
jgi:alpha-L-fucosidase